MEEPKKKKGRGSWITDADRLAADQEWSEPEENDYEMQRIWDNGVWKLPSELRNRD